MHKIILSIAVAVCLMAGSPGKAQASVAPTLSYDAFATVKARSGSTFEVTNTQLTATDSFSLRFQPFDTSKGTLTGVTLTILNAVSAPSFTITDLSATKNAKLKSFDFTLTPSADPISIKEKTYDSKYKSLGLTFSGTTTYTPADGFTQTITKEFGGNFARFTGSKPFSFTLTDTIAFGSVTGTNLGDFNLKGELAPTAKLTYTYTATPIPAAAWLLGSGLAGLLGLRRRFS